MKAKAVKGLAESNAHIEKDMSEACSAAPQGCLVHLPAIAGLMRGNGVVVRCAFDAVVRRVTDRGQQPNDDVGTGRYQRIPDAGRHHNRLPDLEAMVRHGGLYGMAPERRQSAVHTPARPSAPSASSCDSSVYPAHRATCPLSACAFLAEAPSLVPQRRGSLARQAAPSAERAGHCPLGGWGRPYFQYGNGACLFQPSIRKIFYSARVVFDAAHRDGQALPGRSSRRIN